MSALIIPRPITHRLVGYDRATGLVAVEYEIPVRHLEFAKQVARVGADDPDAVLCYRLDPPQARDLAGTIGQHIAGEALTFFLEGFAPV
jgi:hypothetical protein